MAIPIDKAQRYLDEIRKIPKARREAIGELASMSDAEIRELLFKMRELRRFSEESARAEREAKAIEAGQARKVEDAAIQQTKATGGFQFDPRETAGRPKTQKQQIYETLRLGPMKRTEIFVRFIAIPKNNIATHLANLHKEGKIVLVADHTYDGSPEAIATVQRKRGRKIAPTADE
jgi:hypothetical protein